MSAWAKRIRSFTHPGVRNFLGSTFLKQALYELAPDASALQRPATDANFAATTAPMWAWYDALKPVLWRGGAQFPENGPAQRQLMNDGEIDMMISFNPSEAAVSVLAACSPTACAVRARERHDRQHELRRDPYNASAKEAQWSSRTSCSSPRPGARAGLRQMGNHRARPREARPRNRKRFDDLPATRRFDQRRARTTCWSASSWMSGHGRVGTALHK